MMDYQIRRKESITNLCKEVFDELRNITLIDLTYKASNCFEKLLWTLMGIIGVIWAIYFVSFMVRM